MDIIIALVFISLTLVIAGLVFFFSRLVEGDFEHGERLSLLPLADDDGMSDDKSDKKDSNTGDSPAGATLGGDGDRGEGTET